MFPAMNNALKYISLLVVVAAAGCCDAFGQLHPERKHIRSGNKDYEKLDYGASEGDYRTAVSKNPASFEASFNLGDALYKQERFEEAENTFNGLLEETLMTGQQAAKAFHNLGNTQFAQQKLKEAEESYMRSLALNPDDLETKYNLAYVQKLLEDQQGGGGGQDDQNDQQGDNNQDNRNDPDGQSGDSDPQEGDRDEDKEDRQDGEGQDPQEKPEAQQQREGAISKEDAAKMLESMQQQEDKTRDKVNEKQAATTTKSGKNW